MDQQPQPADIDFFMAGCPRCGTTWVHAALKDHPEIFLPAQKQTYFFDDNYEKGLDWYLQNFQGAKPAFRVAGEIATSYSMPHAFPRLAQHFPHARIMLAMRNPAERAYSYFQSRAVSAGWKDIREATQARPEILEQGRYIEHIERILEHYPQERLLLLFYDDLKSNDRQYLQSILQFLGVDTTYESPQFGRMVQVAAFPRVRRLFKKMRMVPVLDFVSASFVGDYLRRYLKKSSRPRYPEMDADTRKFLVDYYQPFNERLASFTGRDLSTWSR